MLDQVIIWYVFGVTLLVEAVLLFIRAPKKSRLFISYVDVLLLAAVGSAVVGLYHPVFGVSFLVVSMFRVVNIMRIGYGRMNDAYLYRVVRPTSVWLLLAHAGVIACGILSSYVDVHVRFVLIGAALVQLCVAVVGLVSIIKNLSLSRLGLVEGTHSNDLPTVTVAIPARNETQDLAECLRTFVASDYQKLEIIVLDDCSQAKSSDIIKRFAHDGVRFVLGDEPGDTWLAKNAAYEKLWHEALGEYVIFCGVDVRVQPDTVSRLVAYAQSRQIKMVSMLPLRSSGFKSAMVAQQLRYLWELALPRFMSHRPPVLSTLWMIERNSLKHLGGFGAVKRKIVPEGYFAQALSRRNQYAFLRSNPDISVKSVKSVAGQNRTAVRVRYPQLHRRPEVVMVVMVFELVAIIGAAPLSVYAILQNVPLLLGLSVMALFAQCATLLILSRAVRRDLLIMSLLQGLCAVPYDLWLMMRSMYGYEFDEVYWKQRNVCLPVMHVVASLPKLD